MPDQGPEPTGWELMRGIMEIKTAIRDSAKATVQRDVYDVDKTAAEQRHRRAEARLTSLEARNVTAETARTEQLEDNEKLRRGQKFALAMAVVGPVIVAVVGIIFNNFRIGI